MRPALSAVVAFSAVAVAACKPAARGLCTTSADCRADAFCSLEGICLSAFGVCRETCAEGEVCSDGTCQALKPVLSIVPPPDNLVGPSRAQLSVQIQAASRIALGELRVEVASDKPLASASVAKPQSGTTAVVLGSFGEPYEGPATAVATLAYRRPDGAIDEVRTIAVPLTYDGVAPAIPTIFFPTGQGEAGGWLPAGGPDAEVRVQVVDGAAGSGAASATLAFDACTPRAPCTYDGTSALTSSSSATFSFRIPRAAQAADAEAPLPFTVTARDRAGNAASAGGALLIDARAPRIGAARIASASALGEDGNTWAPAGASAAPIDVAVSVEELGSGLDPASLKLSLVAADVDVDPGPIAGTLPSPADGTVRFRIPANVLTAREGRVRLTVSAKDKLGQSAAAPAVQPAIWLDAKAPAVTAASAGYASASPAWTQVCGAAHGATFACGRGPQDAPDKVLRDDVVTLTLDVVDCGSGIATAGTPPTSLALTTGGRTRTFQLVEFTSRPGNCANGSANPQHRYTVELDVAGDLPALDAPNVAGVVAVPMQAVARDRTGLATGPVASDLLVSRVRWKRQLAASAGPSGAPVLLPGTAGARDVVVPLAASAPTNNLISVSSTGAQRWALALDPRPQGDVAAGRAALWVGTPGQRTCNTTQQCGTIWALSLGAPADTTPTPIATDVPSTVFASPPAVATLSSTEQAALAVPSARDSLAIENAYAFKLLNGAITPVAKAAIVAVNGVETFGGVTHAAGNIFVSHAHAMSSASFSGTAFGTQAVNTDSSVRPVGSAPPAVVSRGDVANDNPIFPAEDNRVRILQYTPSCGLGPCWSPQWGSGGASGSIVRHTPVFDKMQVVASDQKGTVTSWSLASGALLWQAVAPAGTKPAAGPALLEAPSGGLPGPSLVLAADGRLRRLGAPATGTVPTDTALVQAAAFDPAAVPPTPAVDKRGTRGVAYAADGAGWLWAVHVDEPPLAASAADAWPRPGRDSCNSRSTTSECP